MASVHAQSGYKQIFSNQMPNVAEIPRDWRVVNESDVSDVIRELVKHATSLSANVQGLESSVV